MVKKGRHRRYEEARKLKRRLADTGSIEDIDLDDDSFFGFREDDDGDDDEFGDIAKKYGAFDDEDDPYAGDDEE